MRFLTKNVASLLLFCWAISANSLLACPKEHLVAIARSDGHFKAQSKVVETPDEESQADYVARIAGQANLKVSDTSDEAAVYTRVKRKGKWRTTKSGKKIPIFLYYDQNGKPITGARRQRLEARLKNLGIAIPPTWKQIRIWPHPRAHIQATGVDKAGRTQYMHHPDWKRFAAMNKFEENINFGKHLSNIRAQAQDDLRKHGLPKEKVLAAMALFIDSTVIRVGDKTSEQERKHFGLTTLRKRHVISYGDGSIQLDFKAKKGVRSEPDRPIPASVERVIDKLMDLKGHRLFRYVDEDGRPQEISDDMFNDYLKEASGNGATAKKFRTWWATVLAAEALAAQPIPKTQAEAKAAWKEATELVAEVLQNRPSESEKSYIDPLIKDTWFESPERIHAIFHPVKGAPKKHEKLLTPEERAVLRFLENERERIRH